MRLFLVRHGETEWNKEEIFRGKKDIPLNERGREQARKTGIFLKNFKIEKIYSSPLLRAKETASILSELSGAPVFLMDEFIDIDFGVWEGLPLEEVKKEFPEQFEIWKRYPHRWKVDKSETLKEVRRRVLRGIKLLKKEQTTEVLIVTHRVICKLIAMILLGIPNSGFWKIKFDPASISLFEYDGFNFVATMINETFHLKEYSFHYKDF